MTVATPTMTSPAPSLYKDNKRRRNDNHVSEVLPALLASLSQTAAAGSRVVSLQGGARRPALLNLFFFFFHFCFLESGRSSESAERLFESLPWSASM